MRALFLLISALALAAYFMPPGYLPDRNAAMFLGAAVSMLGIVWIGLFVGNRT